MKTPETRVTRTRKKREVATRMARSSSCILSPYEEMRKAQIADNQHKLVELGIMEECAPLVHVPPPTVRATLL